MLNDFLNSWSLFQHGYLTALLAAVALSLLGVLVIARNQIFLAAAVAQSSVLGVSVALTLGGFSPALGAISLSVASAMIAGGRGARDDSGREEIVAWLFLLSSSVAVLLLAHSPLGLRNVQALLNSSILGASPSDVATLGALALAVVSLVSLASRRLVLLTLDPVMAAAVGLNIARWSMALSALLGLALGLAIRSTGLLFTFGCLVLPGLVARNLSRTVRPLFLLAPCIALAATFAGLLLAHRFDLPPGQAVVSILSTLLLPAWTWRRLRPHLTP